MKILTFSNEIKHGAGGVSCEQTNVLRRLKENKRKKENLGHNQHIP